MRIGGLLKFSLIDYPGKVAAVVFTQGCNYRCPFCHNPELVLPELFTEPVPEVDVLDFLEKRKGQIQGVVVTGGEPTIHYDLPEFLRKIKDRGYCVKLDTNGSLPDVLQVIFDERLVDYVAMDIKSSRDNYCKAAGAQIDLRTVTLSIDLIKESGVPHEFRTTAFKNIVSEKDMAGIRDLIGSGQNYTVRRGNLKDKVLNYDFFADVADYTAEEFELIRQFYSQP